MITRLIWFTWTSRELVKLLSGEHGECHRKPLMISQNWIRWWLRAVRQQAIIGVGVDPDLFRYMASLNHNELIWKHFPHSVAGPLCGESIGYFWNPSTKSHSCRALMVSLLSICNFTMQFRCRMPMFICFVHWVLILAPVSVFCVFILAVAKTRLRLICFVFLVMCIWDHVYYFFFICQVPLCRCRLMFKLISNRVSCYPNICLHTCECYSG